MKFEAFTDQTPADGPNLRVAMSINSYRPHFDRLSNIGELAKGHTGTGAHGQVLNSEAPGAGRRLQARLNAEYHT